MPADRGMILMSCFRRSAFSATGSTCGLAGSVRTSYHTRISQCGRGRHFRVSSQEFGRSTYLNGTLIPGVVAELLLGRHVVEQSLAAEKASLSGGVARLAWPGKLNLQRKKQSADEPAR